MSDPFLCPNCGARVPARAKACPECGSDQETGWSEAAGYLHLLPDRGDTGLSSRRPSVLNRLTPAIAMGVVVAFCFAQGMLWGVLGSVALALVVAYPFLLQRGSRSPQDSPDLAQITHLEDHLQRTLIQKARGDGDLVERLLTYEQHRNPKGNRIQWLTDAHARWDRDRR